MMGIYNKLDLSSLESIRNFVNEYKKSNLPPLKGLVCNAGIITKENQLTKEGYERTFGVNHLGHFLLVNLLLDELVQPAKIIVVSSNTHNPDVREGRARALYARIQVAVDQLIRLTRALTSRSFSW